MRELIDRRSMIRGTGHGRVLTTDQFGKNEGIAVNVEGLGHGLRLQSRNSELRRIFHLLNLLTVTWLGYPDKSVSGFKFSREHSEICRIEVN